MNSTVTQKTKSRKRKTQARKRPATRRRVAKKRAPSSGIGIADWIALGVGGESVTLPEWTDLSTGKNKRKKSNRVRKQVDSLLSGVSTGQFVIVLLVAAISLGFYVSHVFATRDTLSLLEQQRRANLRLELQYNQLKGQLDKKISPNAVYRRALELGLQEGLAFEPVVHWELKESK
ncbi:MAG: hypothetical protein AAF564_01800 [Bacteroidota bacterium]